MDKPILNSAQLKNEDHFNLLITFILNEVQPTSNFPHLKIKFDLPLTDSSLPFASFTWLAQPPSPPSHSPSLPANAQLALSLSNHEQEIHTPYLLILFFSNSSILPGYFSLSLTLPSCQCTALSLSKHEQEIHTPYLLILFFSNSSLLPGYFSLSLTLPSCQCTASSLSLQS